ncbi:hypothetical protein SteCoe_31672 [Stentor coeruleus]|uniref:FAD dependent oxidoreductase domain-containing protein n=1 Tax=Stentor coeruleus TaxID=5963 RepID=A0A1R2B0P2_9CILI|nr:hypothetical protein SteCoe_31672 [Stentor coeruleus]
MEDEKIVIIGGGIIGCSTAWMLKRLSPGCKVLILEKSNGVAQECSFQNGGIFTYSMHSPWNGSSILSKAFKGIRNPNSYYSINPNLFITIDFWVWAWRFFWNSFSGYDKRDDNIFALAKRTNEIHSYLRHEMISKFDKNFEEYMGNDIGLVEVYSTIKGFHKGKAKGIKINNSYNENVHVYSAREPCTKFEPLMSEWSQEITGCQKNNTELFCAHNSYKLSKNLLNLALSQGVLIEYNADVEAFQIKDNKIVSIRLINGKEIIGDKFIICCGVGSREIGKALGWTPPIWPLKGHTFDLETSKKLRHSISIEGDFPLLIANMGDYYRVSGYCEFTTLKDKEISQEKCDFIYKTIKDKLNFKDAEIKNFWACQRPVTVDDLPIIGQFPGLKNAYINAGHGSKGSILSLGSAELMAHIVMGKAPLSNPRPFDPRRFWI